MAGGYLTRQVSVRARFERFPATVKGAFILRGEDSDPHQVELRGGSVVGIGSGTSLPIPMAAASLDVVPHRDVFVPFEVPLGDLEPGWYTLQAELEVDGTPAVFDGGRRFSVPWPRATVRRGQVKVDREVAVEDCTIRVEHVDCSGDSSRVHVRVEPAGPLIVRIQADDDPLEVLEVENDETSGRIRVTAYPVMRAHRALRLEFHRKQRGSSGTLDVPLLD